MMTAVQMFLLNSKNLQVFIRIINCIILTAETSDIRRKGYKELRRGSNLPPLQPQGDLKARL